MSWSITVFFLCAVNQADQLSCMQKLLFMEAVLINNTIYRYGLLFLYWLGTVLAWYCTGLVDSTSIDIGITSVWFVGLRLREGKKEKRVRG